MPGTHVVQLDDATLPADRAAVDCSANVRSGGRAFSRFVVGRGRGADARRFPRRPRRRRGPRPRRRTSCARQPAGDAEAAGAERDWLAGQEPGIDWLFPAPEHNPRAPVVRVAIKHRARARACGCSPTAARSIRSPSRARGSTRPAPSRSACGAASRSRTGRRCSPPRCATPNGASVDDADPRRHLLQRRPVRAELVRDRSLLVADGVTRPVIALRLTDSDGRPVHHGLAGDFEVPAPYYPAVEADAQQARQLAGLERARPVWHVEGDDGVAYVELEPTTASGTVSLRFDFRDGEIDPRAAARGLARSGRAAVDAGRPRRRHGRLQPAAAATWRRWPTQTTTARSPTAGSPSMPRGRILGQWLMTLAYDSDRREDEEPASAASSIPTPITPSTPTAASAATTPPRSAGSISSSSGRNSTLCSATTRPASTSPSSPATSARSTASRPNIAATGSSATAFAADTPEPPPPRRDPGQRPHRPLCARRPQHPRQQRADRRSKSATGCARTGSSSAGC